MPQLLIALFPNQTICSEIDDFKKLFKNKIHQEHIEKISPHITLVPSFYLSEDQVEQLIQSVSLFIEHENVKNINIHLEGFATFHSKSITINVMENDILLQFVKKLRLSLHQQKFTSQRNEKYFFTPHITLFSKGLKNNTFKVLWNHFKDQTYRTYFTVNSISLLEYNGETWGEKKKFAL